MINVPFKKVNKPFQNYLLFFFLRRSFALVTQAAVQWCNLGLPQPPPLRFKRFSCFSLQSSWDYRHAQPHPANYTHTHTHTHAHTHLLLLKTFIGGMLGDKYSSSISVVLFFWDGVSLCRPGWSAVVAWSRLTETSNSLIQALLLPQPPE